MCVISMVMDHYQPIFTPFTPAIEPASTPSPTFTWPADAVDMVALRKLIDEFNAAIAAARKVDTLTGQPDCEDPEKIKLLARVAELEKRLAYAERPRVCWIVKRGDEYLCAPHWRLWDTRSTLVARFESRKIAGGYIFGDDERVVKLVKRS